MSSCMFNVYACFCLGLHSGGPIATPSWASTVHVRKRHIYWEGVCFDSDHRVWPKQDGAWKAGIAYNNKKGALQIRMETRPMLPHAKALNIKVRPPRMTAALSTLVPASGVLTASKVLQRAFVRACTRHTHRHTHTSVLREVPTYRHAHTQAHMRGHAHAHTHTHTYTHTHADTHTHKNKT
jgi:hypothetical protein